MAFLSAQLCTTSQQIGVTYRNLRCQQLRAAFDDLDVPADFLRADIGRRLSECLAIGWLGRAYAFAPGLFESFLPDVFALTAYSDQPAIEVARGDGTLLVDWTLKESSVVARGVPLRLQLEAVRSDDGDLALADATLLAIGCDLTASNLAEASVVRQADQRELCKLLGTPASRKLIGRAVASTVFSKLAPVKAALRDSGSIETIGEETAFFPRHETFAVEGTREKWLQQVAGYYFAQARLQDVRFAAGSGADPEVRFTFYCDESEPLNSEDPRRNVNPEVICCRLAGPVKSNA